MSHLDIQHEMKFIDSDHELFIFYSETERINMAIQMNASNLWLYSDALWIETSVFINFQNSSKI